VIPAKGRAAFNIRYNDFWTSETLEKKIREIIDGAGGNYDLEISAGVESFLTRPGRHTGLLSVAVEEVTGIKPILTTEGGTSDARFISNYCLIAEFGLVNATAHHIDENTRTVDLEDLSRIYLKVLERFFDRERLSGNTANRPAFR
jgi:succinyl-diaminopimelate desuccinylase